MPDATNHTVYEELNGKLRINSKFEKFGNYFFASVWVVFLLIPLYFSVVMTAELWAKVVTFLLSLAIGPVFLYGSIRLNKMNPNRPKNATQQAVVVAFLLLLLSLGTVIVSGMPDFGANMSFLVGILLYCFPLGWSIGLTLLLDFGLFISGTFWQMSGLLWASLYILLWGAIAVVGRVLNENQERRYQYQQDLSVMEERQRIAQDVHDLLGHSLTAINLKAQVLARTATDPKAKQEAQEISQLAREGLVQVRAAVTGLKEVTLGMQVDRTQRLLQATQVKFLTEGDPQVVPLDKQGVCSWVLREAVTNTLRHAKARQVKVVFSPQGMIYADNGHELTEEKLAQLLGAGASMSGNGLSGMRSRLASVNAHLSLDRSAELGGLELQVSWNSPESSQTATLSSTLESNTSKAPVGKE
ncbi:hypothetical protein BK816_08655 [Boudabousia tangfeifanii]|uniref:Signal transduction histidine kinase subgroup 3 dimerisation and phosphoacceptor domain-containing protein n=1 Tax=Boudabousia tangfeifanii TaxID=1912795 RepID=A0A1D9MM08_9ACTO|nr:histidine kinase [Boudabousia tangfeifanii]AOZ73332.1 hypothetical protein BK816_08655 [Boudabousia tangfeifanii]